MIAFISSALFHIKPGKPSVSVIHLEKPKRPRSPKYAAPTAPDERVARRAIVAGSGERSGWLMAFGIDLGSVALELAMLAVPADKRFAVAHYASSAIVGTSATMNEFSFAFHGLVVDPPSCSGLPRCPLSMRSRKRAPRSTWKNREVV